MKRSDAIPTALVLLDVDDPICSDEAFIGMVKHAELFAWHTFGEDTEKLRADKANPDFRGCLTLRGKYAFELYEDTLNEFIARAMINSTHSRSLTFIEAATWPDGAHGMQFILSTTGPLPGHDKCTAEVAVVKLSPEDIPSPFYSAGKKPTLN